MHAVPSARSFEFPVSFDVAIPQMPEDADRPTSATPFWLRDFRYLLSEAEDDMPPVGQASWFIPFSDISFDRNAGVVALATPFYAESKAREVFAAWQASRPVSRFNFILSARAVTGQENYTGIDEPGIVLFMKRGA